MSKTGFGFILVGGLLVCIVSGFFVACGSMVPPSPSMDLFYDFVKYSGALGVIAGIVMFLYGAKGLAAK